MKYEILISKYEFAYWILKIGFKIGISKSEFGHIDDAILFDQIFATVQFVLVLIILWSASRRLK